MKTVVITGSARGFGFAMLKFFRENGFNTVLSDVNLTALMNAKEELEKIKSEGKVLYFNANVTNMDDIKAMIDGALNEFKTIDIWINNAGVNQFMLPIWEIYDDSIEKLVDIDFKGTILCSKAIMNVMKQQGFGQIYNVEGMGSNDAFQYGLSIYGSCKRGVTYFTKALARESEHDHTGVLIGRITPGIMITNFINTSNGDGDKFELSERTKKVYNILGDYPETIAEFMVTKIVSNKKNNVRFVWLTNARAMWRFMNSWHNKRDFF